MNGLFITITPYIDHYGYLAVFGAILLEDFGMPVPGETLLIAGALLASRGKMDIVTLLWTACIAAITGDNIGYAIGRFGGRGLVLRYGRYVLITEGRLGKAEGFFRRYGGVVVVMTRVSAFWSSLPDAWVTKNTLGETPGTIRIES